MSGNELTIRWALFGVAMTCASLAVSQAGWKDPALIDSLLVLATLCFLASIFWTTLSKYITALQKITPFLNRHLRTQFTVQALTAVSLLGAIYVTIQLAFGNVQQTQGPITGISIDPQLPVESAYNNDFKKYLRMRSNVDFHNLFGDEHVEGMQQLIINFEANSEFLAFYIPHTEMVYSICFNISDNFDKLLAHSRSILFTEQEVGDINKIKSENLTFSGVVYIYTEDALDEKGMKAVEDKFTPHKISVRFRNPLNIKGSKAPQAD